MARYTFHRYRGTKHQLLAVYAVGGIIAAELVGDIRDNTTDMPVCYVHDAEDAHRLIAALRNASACDLRQKVHAQETNVRRKR